MYVSKYLYLLHYFDAGSGLHTCHTMLEPPWRAPYEEEEEEEEEEEGGGQTVRMLLPPSSPL